MDYILADDDFIQNIRKDEADEYLFLENHPNLQRQWLVNSFDPTFLANMGNTIKSYQAIGPFEFDRFSKKAKEKGYKIVFLDDPTPVFDWVDSLNKRVGFSINSDMEGTIDGFLPYQIQAVNFAKDSKACIFNHSTGTGKSIVANGVLEWHMLKKDIDLCIYVVKSHNKINTQRSIKKFLGYDSHIAEGTPKKREKIYKEVDYEINNGISILITNYEKFRNDKKHFINLIEGRRLLIIFDEMPTKLKNRGTSLYQSVTECLYKSFRKVAGGKRGRTIYFPRKGAERALQMHSVMLSATPIENSPEDFFNCCRLMDPSVYGSINDFNNRFVAGRDQWGKITHWKNIDLMGAMAAHIVHQVDKNDPDIAAQFPQVIEDTIYIDLSPQDQKLYDTLADEYKKISQQSGSILDDTEILAAINVLQMICNNSRSVLESAKKREKYYEKIDELEGDQKAIESLQIEGSEVALKLREMIDHDGSFLDSDRNGNLHCNKLLALKDILENHNGKAIIFTRMNETLIPIISEHLKYWGISHTTYHGKQSSKTKQFSEDRFKNDDECMVFLSSDAGSDSINLEMADLVIHYDLPWTWAKLIQRQNRAHRVTSKTEKVKFLTFLVADTVEDRAMEILEQKKKFHEDMMKGEIAEQSINLRKSDLIYILTGEYE